METLLSDGKGGHGGTESFTVSEKTMESLVARIYKESRMDEVPSGLN